MRSDGRSALSSTLPGPVRAALALSGLLVVACSATPPAEAPVSPEPDPSLAAEDGDSDGAGMSAGVDAIQAEDFAKAQKFFEAAVAEQPSNAAAHFYLGVALQNLGKGDEASSSYEKAVNLDPKLAEAWVNLTAAKLDAGDAAGALPFIERGLRNHPDNPALLYNHALALSGAGKSAEAPAAYRKAIAADVGNSEIEYGYAEALVAAGSKDEAVKVLEGLAQKDDVAVLASSARLLGRLQEFDGCIRALNKALERTKSSELFVARGLCQHGKRKDTAAFEDFQRAAQTDPGYAPAHYYVGMHLKTLGKKSEARTALARAVQIAGDEGIGKAAKRALESL